MLCPVKSFVMTETNEPGPETVSVACLNRWSCYLQVMPGQPMTPSNSCKASWSASRPTRGAPSGLQARAMEVGLVTSLPHLAISDPVSSYQAMRLSM